jgi:undecaprenyl pyrophosphate synthase
MPNIHMAYVPDGNRRYAAERGISLRESYQISFLHSIQLVQWMLLDHPRIKEFTIGLAAEYNLSRVSDQAVSLVQGRLLLSSLSILSKSAVSL